MSTIKFKPYTTEMDINLLFKSVSECGKIEVGVYPVIFGFRVRAGFVGNQWTEIDYCCGDKQETVELIYSLCINILEKQDFSSSVFDIFPYQERKPFPLDVENFAKLVKLGFVSTEQPYKKLPDIHSAKTKYLSKYI